MEAYCPGIVPRPLLSASFCRIMHLSRSFPCIKVLKFVVHGPKVGLKSISFPQQSLFLKKVSYEHHQPSKKNHSTQPYVEGQNFRIKYCFKNFNKFIFMRHSLPFPPTFHFATDQEKPCLAQHPFLLARGIPGKREGCRL